ncbi:MAG: hypothetical protein AB1757_29145 [Acidobacteriota bacterium]
MNYLLKNWHKITLIVLPAMIVTISSAALFRDWRQTDSQKAIRLVRESKSRKENFTIQQYLYATVYYYQQNGEAITIEGWRAEPDAAPAQFLISFTYSDSQGTHQALWEANPSTRKVTPKNKEASDLSWQ